MAKAWQHPFLNVFRHFKVGEWKRSTKEGDVTPVTDKTLKCTVYRIRGSVSAGNYIQLPQTSTQSLGLTGRYLYVLFRPLPSKHFVIHLDVATEDSQVIRVSFSSLFREFKSTATWLQFPFICEAGKSRKDLAGVAPSGARWTCLQLDLQDILLVYLNRRYGHLKSVRLCASLLVKSLYTSDLCFDPAVTVAEARRAKLPVTPVPREMAFPVPKGDSWHEHYIHIRFPSVGSRASSEPAQKSRSPPEAVFPGRVRELVPPPVAFSNPFPDGVSPAVQMFGPTAARPVPRPLPEVSLFCEHSEVPSMNGPRDRSQEPSARAEVTDKHTAGNGVRTAAPESAVVPVALEDVAPRQPPGRKQSRPEMTLGETVFEQRSFLPDPILKLKGVIGFGGRSTKWWTCGRPVRTSLACSMSTGWVSTGPAACASVGLRTHTWLCPGARQLEDTEAGTGGLPRQQVPVPSQASPLQLGARAGPLKGADGAFSTADEEGPSQESHNPEGLHQASSLPMLVKEASGAGDGAQGAAGGPWGFSMRPHPCGWATARSTTKAQAHPSARPDCYRHFTARYKASSLVKSASVPSARVERLLLKAVVGYNGNGRANVVWKPDTGFFAYTCGCLVVVEDLHSGAQRHWLGHPEEISTLALSHNAQILASASGCSSTASRCQIRIWDVPGGSCRHLLSYHDTAVQALAFSPDDTLLVTLGDYGDRTLALWSVATCELLSSVRLPEPAHGVAFNPRDARELTCVGQGAIISWLLQQRGADVTLQVHREPIPEEVEAGELTSLCYGATPLLYCGSNAGRVCVWDTCAGRCFLAWEADDGEIGVLLCSGARLVSGSNTRRLRLWAVGAVPELRRKGVRARSSSVFMEHELTLDGAIVSAVFHDSMDMGVVGTTAGTLWYVSWAKGTSTRLISGHRSKNDSLLGGVLGGAGRILFGRDVLVSLLPPRHSRGRSGRIADRLASGLGVLGASLVLSIQQWPTSLECL
ncbi:WD repeat-containing protein 90-like [Puma concolor]|uniref:WD repeat-containing protein 90-like n=1 Tax=Puma concolor TaxID=9696 RepID=A0A6P6HUC1_PUMCO|nr:WD repeat-containing protein 90-like [Puma concolor]